MQKSHKTLLGGLKSPQLAIVCNNSQNLSISITMDNFRPKKDPQQKEFSENYNSTDTMPDNVSDLLVRTQLDNARDVYKLIEARSELNSYQDRELAVKIIGKLVNYHNSAIDKFVDEGKAELVAGWAVDLQRLTSAIELLEAVDLSDE